MLEVTPHDGSEPGQAAPSDPIEIVNSPPQITSTPPERFGGGRYIYQVAAIDKDGDPLTYSLAAAPAGMAIDPKTGRLEWKYGPEVRGDHTVRVTVSDGHEEEQTWQEFRLTFQENGQPG